MFVKHFRKQKYGNMWPTDVKTHLSDWKRGTWTDQVNALNPTEHACHLLEMKLSNAMRQRLDVVILNLINKIVQILIFSLLNYKLVSSIKPDWIGVRLVCMCVRMHVLCMYSIVVAGISPRSDPTTQAPLQQCVCGACRSTWNTADMRLWYCEWNLLFVVIWVSYVWKTHTAFAFEFELNSITSIFVLHVKLLLLKSFSKYWRREVS